MNLLRAGQHKEAARRNLNWTPYLQLIKQLIKERARNVEGSVDAAPAAVEDLEEVLLMTWMTSPCTTHLDKHLRERPNLAASLFRNTSALSE
jgi:hypothetical protein